MYRIIMHRGRRKYAFGAFESEKQAKRIAHEMEHYCRDARVWFTYTYQST